MLEMIGRMSRFVTFYVAKGQPTMMDVNPSRSRRPRTSDNIALRLAANKGSVRGRVHWQHHSKNVLPVSKEQRTQDCNANAKDHFLTTASTNNTSKAAEDDGSFCDVPGTGMGFYL